MDKREKVLLKLFTVSMVKKFDISFTYNDLDYNLIFFISFQKISYAPRYTGIQPDMQIMSPGALQFQGASKPYE